MRLPCKDFNNGSEAGARKLTKIDSYLPEVAKAMKEQGINSFQELWQKIVPFLEANPDFFKGVSKRSAYRCARGDFITNNDSHDNEYARECYAVAAALNEDVVGLFGSQEQEKELTLESLKSAGELLYLWGDKEAEALQGPLEVVQQKQLKQAFSVALGSLNPEQSEVLSKLYIENMTYSQIDDAMGFYRGRAKSVEQSAINKIQRNNKLRNSLRPFLRDDGFPNYRYFDMNISSGSHNPGSTPRYSR